MRGRESSPSLPTGSWDRQAILKGIAESRTITLTFRSPLRGFYLGIGVTVARVTLDHLV
jgi:hypothetical protein